jgi:hypothetical protein
MKRILSAALALCMVLSLSVTVFADPAKVTVDTSIPAEQMVNARKINDAVKAEVVWNPMEFVYDAGAKTWRVGGTDGNLITVTNISPTATINTTFSYIVEADTADNSIGLFDNSIANYHVSDPLPETGYNRLRYNSATAGNTPVMEPEDFVVHNMGPNTYKSFYLMFTGNEDVSKLNQSSAKVGTLRITIAEATN